MAAPLFKVEVAFADGPNAAAPSYTDISQYVRRDPALTYSRGSQDEVSGLQAGTMSFVVDNSNGRFTPGSSASTSAWGTTLKIRRPVRLSIWNGSSYVVTWTGTVDDWGTGWVGGVQGQTQVSCSDAVAAAGRIDMPAAIMAEILSDAPHAYYPLNDPADSSQARDATGDNRPPLYAAAFALVGPLKGTYAFGTDGAPGPDPMTMATFATGTDAFADTAYVQGSDTTFNVNDAGTTVEAFFYLPTDVRAGGNAILASWPGGSLYVDDTMALRGNDNGGLSLLTSSRKVAAGRMNHAAFRQSASGGTVTTTLLLNGVSVASGSYAAAAVVDSTGLLTIGDGVDGSISNVAVYKSALSDARLLDHSNAMTSWTGESTGARWSRLCRVAGLGSTTYTADATTGTMGSLPTEGSTLTALLQRVVDLENGSAFCSTGGVLTLKARSNRYDKASTLTIAPQTLEPDLSFVTNDAYLVNEAAVADDSGEVGRASSASSVTDYGVSRRSMSVASDTYEQALNLAQWFTYRYSQPGTRARTVSVNATAKAASVTTTNLLALDVDSRITLSPLPAVAPASSVQLFIDGVAGSISDELVFTFNTSPTTFLDGWILGTDVLDTGTLLLY